MHGSNIEGENDGNSENYKKFQNQIRAFVIIYIVVVLIGLVIESLQTGFRGKLLIDAAVAIATILMVGYIALQTRATKDMVKEAARQAQLTYQMVKQMIQETALMNETLIEMKKQRLNVEEFKNSLVSYLQYLRNTISARKGVVEPKLYILSGYRKRMGTPYLSPAEEGFLLRLSKFIEKFLEVHGIPMQELREYGFLISKLQDNRTPRSEKPRLVMRIQEKSRELLEIVENIFQEIEEMGDKKLEDEILKILES